MAKAKFVVGQNVVFNGYGEDVPEDERLLVEGETYEVVEVNAKEETVSMQIENPDFNPKKKESEANAKMILVDVFFDEVSEPSEEAGEDEAGEEEAGEEEAAAPTRSRTKPAAPVKAAAKAAPAAKGKVAAKPAAPAAKGKAAPAAKGKAVAKPKVKEEPAEEEDTMPALENEDADILALIDGADILELASELVEEGAALDYKLGGVLYHVRQSKAYQELDEAYKENGGFGLYVKDKLNIEYRKAMYLIDIYYKFNLFGIDAAKVQELGWTKCSKIAAVMTEENSGELVELAEGSSVSELNDAIKESYKEVGGTKGEKRKKIMFKFRLWEDQASAVEEVINATAAAMGHKDISDTFEHIVMEWAAEHPLTKKTVAARPAATAKAAPAAAAKPAAKVAARAAK